MRNRLTRPLRAVLLLAALAIIAVGCSSAGLPQSYDDQPFELDNGEVVSNVELNFLEGCEVGLVEDRAAAANAICACSYDKIRDEIPFADFVELNDRVQGDPDVLSELAGVGGSAAETLVQAVAGCIQTVDPSS